MAEQFKTKFTESEERFSEQRELRTRDRERHASDPTISFIWRDNRFGKLEDYCMRFVCKITLCNNVNCINPVNCDGSFFPRRPVNLLSYSAATCIRDETQKPATLLNPGGFNANPTRLDARKTPFVPYRIGRPVTLFEQQ